MFNLSSKPRKAGRRLKMRRALLIAGYFLFFTIFSIASAVFAANSCININTASLEELDKIKYVGESRAKQIIILRGEKLFSSVDELDRVIGIGPAIVAKIKQEGMACASQQEPQSTTTALSLEVRPPREAEPQNVIPITYSSGIIFSEIMPSPEGPDETEEWIKIFNKNNFKVDLSDWQITDTVGKTNTYTFPAGIKISAMGFLVLNRPETKIILNNNADGLKLIQPDGKVIDSVNYEKALRGQSYGPGAVNTIKEVEEKGLAAISEPIIIGQNKRSFPPLLAALALAIFSVIIILFLYKKKLIKKDFD